jgi:hypothetical protein
MALETLGRELVSPLTTAQTLTVPAGTTHAWLQALTQNVRITLDGTTAEAAVGMRLTAGDPPIEITGEEARNGSFIEEAVGGTLEVIYKGNSL